MVDGKDMERPRPGQGKDRVRINQLVKPETRNALLILKVRLGKRTIGEVIDELIKTWLNLLC